MLILLLFGTLNLVNYPPKKSTGKITDFSQFIVNRKIKPYILIKDITTIREDELSPKNRSVSSAYKAMLSSPRDLRNPIMFGDWGTAAKGLRAKRRGDYGHPCFVPWSMCTILAITFAKLVANPFASIFTSDVSNIG